MFLCDYIANLRGIVQSSQISGFTIPYTHLLLSALFAVGDDELHYKTPKGSPWPIFLPGSVIIPTPKVVSEFEFGIQSKKSQLSNAMTVNEIQDVKTITDLSFIDEPPRVVSDTTDLGSSHAMNNSSSVIHGHDYVHAEDMEPTQDDALSINRPDTSDAAVPSPCIASSSIPQSGPDDMITALLSSSSIPQSGLEDEVTARPSTPEQNKPTPYPNEPSGPINQPSSPNAMNKLNEQDPAFRRALDALRLADQQNKASTNITGCKSVVSSFTQASEPDPVGRCLSGLKKPIPMAKDKRHPSFLGRINGMFSK